VKKPKKYIIRLEASPESYLFSYQCSLGYSPIIGGAKKYKSAAKAQRALDRFRIQTERPFPDATILKLKPAREAKWVEVSKPVTHWVPLPANLCPTCKIKPEIEDNDLVDCELYEFVVYCPKCGKYKPATGQSRNEAVRGWNEH
jgi:hypothetical protein